ncbi:MAG: DUF447 family protein [Planctomycetota bacterium]|nr:MAG: DUF447 family protein [Planctomycetota bacterium]
MIIEGVVTTRNADGGLNIAPMGVQLDEPAGRIVFRPFRSSRTCENLLRTRQAVFHVLDDALLLARALLDRFDTPPATRPAERIDGAVLLDACRWYECVVTDVAGTQPRDRILGRIVHRGRLRDFVGWNRAKHAVVEAAILASRKHLIHLDRIRQQWEWLSPMVEKTGGPEEREAFTLLTQWVFDEPPRSTAD